MKFLSDINFFFYFLYFPSSSISFAFVLGLFLFLFSFPPSCLSFPAFSFCLRRLLVSLFSFFVFFVFFLFSFLLLLRQLDEICVDEWSLRTVSLISSSPSTSCIIKSLFFSSSCSSSFTTDFDFISFFSFSIFDSAHFPFSSPHFGFRTSSHMFNEFQIVSGRLYIYNIRIP